MHASKLWLGLQVGANTLLTIAARLGATERVENAVTARLDAVTRRVVIDAILTRIIISPSTLSI